MKLVSNNDNKKIFLCLNETVHLDSKTDIILSPEFYWVRAFDIPVNSKKQALSILPSLFEDYIESYDDLSYEAIDLEDGKYLCFAYSNKKIFDELKKSVNNLSLINSIYFAQNECEDFEQFFIQDKFFSYTQDKILVKLPASFSFEKRSLNLSKIKLSSNSIDIKLYNSKINTKSLYTLVSFILIFAFINLYKLYDYKSEISNLEKQKEEIANSSKMPNSMIRVDSIINANKTKIKSELKKRDALEYILNNKNLDIKKAHLENNILTLSIKSSDKSQAISHISKRYKIISSNISGFFIDIKVKL